MDESRVVDVIAQRPDGKISFGSGYLLGPDLILTAGHVIGAQDRAVVRFLDRGDEILCEVAWVATDGVDAALLKIADPSWSVPVAAAPARLGRLVTSSHGIPWEAIGFPWAQDRTSFRDTEHASGRLNAATARLAGRHHVTVTSGTPRQSTGDSPWAGMSGAAVFSGSLLIGVVIEDTPNFSSGRLTVEPLARMAMDTKFGDVIAEATGLPFVLEPVELAEAVKSARPGHPPRSPGWLLRAELAAVRFRGRDSELAELVTWCQTLDAANAPIRLVTGSAGQGKTRLAKQLAVVMRADGWIAEELAKDVPDTMLGSIGRCHDSLLLILDYAETQDISSLLRRVANHTGSKPVRLLLLARSAGDWWRALTEEIPQAVAVLDLGPLEAARAGRDEAFGEALRDFADALSERFPDDLAITPADVEIPDLSQPRYGSALTLHMAALATLLHGGTPTEPPEEVILAREARYWRSVAKAQRLSFSGTPVHDLILERIVAAASLCGAANATEAVDLVAHLPGVPAGDENLHLLIVDWLRELYPPAVDDEESFWGTLQPDRLGEELIARAARRLPTMLPALFGAATPPQQVHALSVLCRAISHQADLAALTTDLVVSRQVRIAAVAFVATRTENPGPLVLGLSVLLRVDPDDLGVQSEVAAAIPATTQSLAHLAAVVQMHLVASYRTLAGTDPGTYLRDLWRALHDLAIRLTDIGFLDEARAASHDALAVCEGFVDPDSETPESAISTCALAVRIADSGRAADAINLQYVGVERWRQLANKHQTYLPNLAAAELNYSTMLATVGRAEDAVRFSSRALKTYLQLETDAPGTCTREVTTALHNQASRLAGVGHFDEALDCARECVRVRRLLAEHDEDAHRADLASALDTLGGRLAEAGHPEAAVESLRESVGLQPRLVHINPEAHLPNLAESQNNLCAVLVMTGHREEALAMLREATGRLREFIERNPNPDRHLPSLSALTKNLALQLDESGHVEEALAAAADAAALLRRLAKDLPDTYLAEYGEFLRWYIVRLNAAGRANDEVVTYRRLVEIDGTARPGLAMALTSLSMKLDASGQAAEALAAANESMRVMETLDSEVADRIVEGICFVAINLARLLVKAEQYAEAVENICVYLVLCTKPDSEGAKPERMTSEIAIALLGDAWRRAPDQVEAAWREITGVDLPPWMSTDRAESTEAD